MIDFTTEKTITFQPILNKTTGEVLRIEFYIDNKYIKSFETSNDAIQYILKLIENDTFIIVTDDDNMFNYNKNGGEYVN